MSDISLGMIGGGLCLLVLMVGYVAGQWWASRKEPRRFLPSPQHHGLNERLPTDWETGYQPYLILMQVREQFEQLPERIRRPIEALHAFAERTGAEQTAWDCLVGKRPGEDYFMAFVNRSGHVPRYTIYYANPQTIEVLQLFAAVVGIDISQEEPLCWPPDDA